MTFYRSVRRIKFISGQYPDICFFSSFHLSFCHLHRFSRDVDALDNVLWSTIYDFLITVVTLIGSLALIVITFPWMFLAVIPVVLIYYFISIYYRSTSREIKRLDSNLRSHLYAYFSESLTGLSTLKAFQVLDKTILKNEYWIDTSSAPYYMFQLGSRWVSVRVNTLGAFLTFTTVIMMVATRGKINPSSAGLVLSYLARTSGDMNWGVQRLSTLENNMNSAERLWHYVRNLVQESLEDSGKHSLTEKEEKEEEELKILEGEEDRTCSKVLMTMEEKQNANEATRAVAKLEEEQHEGKMPTEEELKNWPSQGAIWFDRVSMRYRPELPQVLREISFKVQPGEKCK
jgi:ABC-type multidrug transport system fused ATPase/permease subunit